MIACSPEYVFSILGRKWSYRVLRECTFPQRFCDLQRSFSAITNRVLSAELRFLCDEGLCRTFEERYFVTLAGMSLLRAAQPVIDWAQEHTSSSPCAWKDCVDCASLHVSGASA